MRSTLQGYSASKILSLSDARLTCTDETILDLWGVGPNRAPIDTHHPAVITHPVTGLKALNVTNGLVTGFAELKKKESG
jgi:alpha-ketoglutarate-dependent taurine dioxygenase